MKNIQTIIIALTCSILLGACSAVRQCKPPELNLPESIISGATDTLTLADIEWWRFYGDSALCDIISRTLENNRNIQRPPHTLNSCANFTTSVRPNYCPRSM